ncbi:hypothetical protein L4X63_16930 [Geomonas sp. Red32]|uniref:hypothetical protein n=1 Tax=Geomonas sp. Red32 TaxID=2912856 RepID=UPI00202CB7B1|nr:hypothetical protein [Geomonas sp. Red32]MCM0083272.1 hypothetical protein [Geomonas sp. Red32]
MNVFTMTCSTTPDGIYGNMLALRTLRTGFPTANITVTDNASCWEARHLFGEMCSRYGYTFRTIDIRIRHHEFIEDVVATTTGPLAIVDPDCVFWEDCEPLVKAEPGVLLRGRLFPALEIIRPNILRKIVVPRLHTSFLAIPDAQKLYVTLAATGTPAIWQQHLLRITGPDTNVLQDTGARVYELLGTQAQPFREAELDRYDHYINGTTGGPVALTTYPDVWDCTADYQHLKGAWKIQEESFSSYQVSEEWERRKTQPREFIATCTDRGMVEE